MEIVLAYVGLAGFALSLLNLFLIFWQRRVALKSERAIIIVSNHGHVYLDMVVSNRSGLPVSVTSADLLDDRKVWIRGDANASDMLTTTDGETGEKSSVPVTTQLPIPLSPFEARRIVLRFAPDQTLDRVLRWVSDCMPRLQAGREAPKDLLRKTLCVRLYTSRRPCKVACLSEIEDYEHWLRRFLRK